MLILSINNRTRFCFFFLMASLLKVPQIIPIKQTIPYNLPLRKTP